MNDTMRFEWAEAIEFNTIEGYTRFISRYPNSDYKEDATRRIQYMKSLLDDLKNNPSNYSRERMYEIISSNLLSREDLVDNYGILSDRAYGQIKRYPKLENEQRELPISRIENPSSKDGSIDVIFWGLPGVGVTCLLLGLLGLGGRLGFDFDPRGKGGGGPYAVELQNYARRSMLPPHIKDVYIQVIEAQLSNENDYTQNISLIKMPGEKLSNHLLTGNSICWNDLGVGAEDLLSNDNKKMLFFVIEPSNEKKFWMEDGEPIIIKQSDVIKSVLSLLQKENKIMKKIDAIHFVLTKSDLLGDYIDYNTILDILTEEGHMDCLRFAKSICQNYGINIHMGYDVELYSFSLGKFMPGDVYTYDETDSLKILRRLQSYLPRPPMPRRGPFEKIRNWFNSQTE